MMASVRARLPRPPAQGWVSLFLVAALAVIVAWSLDDASLVLGRGEWTDFLAWAALGGVIAGFVGARVGWNRPLAHLIGAIFAVLIVGILVGSVLDVGLVDNPGQRFGLTATATVNAILDFAYYRLPLTRQTGHYMLVLGLLCWANGQFAASAVFRHSRPIGPIVVLGAVLVANMAASSNDNQIWYLVLFSVVALFLLIRLHAVEEQSTWMRRRIGDPKTVGRLYLRGGTIFIMLAVFFAWTLTASARSAPLAGFWENARPTLVEVSQFLQRIIPPAPGSRPIGFPTFGGQVTVGGIWSTSDDPALEIQRPAGNTDPLYWRATTYDTFTLTGWTTADPTSVDAKAGTDLLATTADAIPKDSLRAPMTITVTPKSSLFRTVFSPIDALSIDQDATVNLAGALDPSVQSIGLSGSGPYTIQAALPVEKDVPGGLTANRLRAAGQAYPPDIVARYTTVPKGAMGDYADQLFAQVMARAKITSKNQVTPYDVAQELVTELHSSEFKYSTNVLGQCDSSSSIVECFAEYKVGYCEHYASTMAILLRNDGIPARLVEGFLPGTLDKATGIEEVRTGGAHAWVEVYFPGYGWQMFDPTGGGISRTQNLIQGQVVPLATTKPLASLPLPSGAGRDAPDELGPGRKLPGGVAATSSTSTPVLLGLAIALLVAVLLVSFLAWRRGPRDVTTPDGVYASVAGLARRFGFGPRPTQTAYEYAAALGDILPSVRPELQTVASAKVEVAYGRRQLGDERMRAVRDAYHRLRVGLLRLALRRRDRRKMR